MNLFTLVIGLLMGASGTPTVAAQQLPITYRIRADAQTLFRARTNADTTVRLRTNQDTVHRIRA